MAKKAAKKKEPKRSAKRTPKQPRMSALEVERYFTDEVLLAMGKAGTDPAFAYAFKQTGLLPPIKGSRKQWPKNRLQEWKAAVAEYEEIQAARNAPDAPPPELWSTNIPSLALSGFNKDDYARVRALIRAIEPVEKAGPMTLRARWEFAAAVLSTTLHSAYSAGMDSPTPEKGLAAVEMIFEFTIALVVERAREIYAQGGG